MKVVIGVILLAFLLFLGVQSKLFFDRGRSAEADLRDAESELERVRADSDAIRSDRDYYSNPLNLEKELRARFNYRSGDERLMILVPPSTSTR